MTNKKFKEMEKMDTKTREEKLKELRLDLIKKSLTANKGNKGKAKEIKKAIARLLTINTIQNKKVLDKKQGGQE